MFLFQAIVPYSPQQAKYCKCYLGSSFIPTGRPNDGKIVLVCCKECVINGSQDKNQKIYTVSDSKSSSTDCSCCCGTNCPSCLIKRFCKHAWRQFEKDKAKQRYSAIEDVSERSYESLPPRNRGRDRKKDIERHRRRYDPEDTSSKRRRRLSPSREDNYRRKARRSYSEDGRNRRSNRRGDSDEFDKSDDRSNRQKYEKRKKHKGRDHYESRERNESTKGKESGQINEGQANNDEDSDKANRRRGQPTKSRDTRHANHPSANSSRRSMLSLKDQAESTDDSESADVDEDELRRQRKENGNNDYGDRRTSRSLRNRGKRKPNASAKATKTGQSLQNIHGDAKREDDDRRQDNGGDVRFDGGPMSRTTRRRSRRNRTDLISRNDRLGSLDEAQSSERGRSSKERSKDRFIIDMDSRKSEGGSQDGARKIQFRNSGTPGASKTIKPVYRKEAVATGREINVADVMRIRLEELDQRRVAMEKKTITPPCPKKRSNLMLCTCCCIKQCIDDKVPSEKCSSGQNNPSKD